MLVADRIDARLGAALRVREILELSAIEKARRGVLAM
jgi:hypothetical protein